MKTRTVQIDIFKLVMCLLRRAWIIVLCAAIGFGFVYWRTRNNQRTTYSAYGTLYVYNGNPNTVNYQYTSVSDLNSAVQLLDTYMVVVRSNKVMNAVAERLAPEYPGISTNYIASTLSMGSVAETGVLQVRCVTENPQMSADICNAVLDVAPAEIVRVVSAGSCNIIDYAEVPTVPDSYSPMRQSVIGGLIGAGAAIALLILLFLLNRRILEARDLTDNYTPPLLVSVRRLKVKNTDPDNFVLSDNTPMEIIESYAKLRMNLLYTLVGKESNAVVVTSAISGEGKSTIAANLAISCTAIGKKILLVDADMRRARQREIFKYGHHQMGLSDILIGQCRATEAIMPSEWEGLDILPAGHTPPNAAELLETSNMRDLVQELGKMYDLVLFDMPPINVVSDPLTLSSQVAGCLFVVRQYFSDHREVRKALLAAEMTDMNILGFVFYGEKVMPDTYYSKKYYTNYYKLYDTRGRNMFDSKSGDANDERKDGTKEGNAS